MIHLCHVPLLADRKAQDFGVYGVCGGPDPDQSTTGSKPRSREREG